MTAHPDPVALLCRDCVLTGVAAKKPMDVFQALADPLSRATGIPPELIADRMLARERVGSTGFGRGAAIPHARFPELEGCVAAFAVLQDPVDFGAIDSQPVDLVFALMSPEQAGADHLAALAAISRLFRDDTKLRRLRGARDADAVYAILSQEGWRNAA